MTKGRTLRLHIALAALMAHGLVAAALVQAQRPEMVLEQRWGLKRLPSSNVWVVPLELELRTMWAELPQHRDAVNSLDKALSERIQRNAAEWAAAAKTETTLRARLAELSPSDRNRPPLEQQLAALRNGLAPPAELGNLEDVRAQLIELTGRRNALWLTSQSIRHKTRLLADAYAPLAGNTEVAAILAKAGDKFRLGPARKYADELKKLPDFEKTFLTPWVPLHRLGERQRLTLIANETTPMTFTWTSSPEAPLITAAMAEAIGLRPRADAATQQVTVERRAYRARAARLSYLQFGKFQLREVEIFILPPEAESAGARISPAAFEGYRAEIQPERLRMVLTPLVPLDR